MLIKEVEKKLEVDILRDKLILGIDTASRTGWCLLKTNSKELTLDYGFINVDTKDEYIKYNELIKIFDGLIKPEYSVIIEDTFFRFNPKMFRLISRIGAIAYTISHLKGCDTRFLAPSPSRKNLGFKGNDKKAIFHKNFLEKLELDIKDIDIIDAIVLALNGVAKKETLL